MALGPVSVGGSGYTHAAIDLLLKKAMYSDGKLVYTGSATFSYNSDGKLTLPDEVDYVKLTCTRISNASRVDSYRDLDGAHLARGSTLRPNNCAAIFDSSGALRFVGNNATYKSDSATYRVEGYHYY